MKIRIGFVSNSSSSSFIVKVKDLFQNPTVVLLNKEDAEKLLKFGFIYTDIWNASDLEVYGRHNIEYKVIDKPIKVSKKLFKDDPDLAKFYQQAENNWFKAGNHKSVLGYYVTCNQDDVKDFLVANKIPFRACCHYGDYILVYDGKRLKRIENKGNQTI